MSYQNRNIDNRKILLIAGGAIIGTSVLGAVAMAKGGLTAIQSSFLVVVIMGYIIMGLGIFRYANHKTAIFN